MSPRTPRMSLAAALAILGLGLALPAPASALVRLLFDDVHDFDDDSLDGNFSNFRDVVQGAGHEIREVTGSPGDLTPASLVAIDALFIQDSELGITPAERLTIYRFVEDGGLLVVLGEEPGNWDDPNMNLTLGPWGIGFTETGIDGTTFLDSFEPNEPLTDGITSVTLRNTGTLALTGIGTRVLGLIAGGPEIGYAWAKDGAILVAGDATLAQDSLIDPNTENEAFLLNMLDHLDASVPTIGACDRTFVLDFECLSAGTPVDETSIGTHYDATFGVRFGVDVDGDGFADANRPLIEASGEGDGATLQGSGFRNGLLAAYDTAATGLESRLGDFFLRHDRSLPDRSLVLTYHEPVSGASGEIWDIDGSVNGTEQWRVEALGADYVAGDPNAVPLASLDSPLGDLVDQPLDGQPWIWSFDRGATADIHAVRIRFIGTNTTDPDAGFNNLSPSFANTPAPAPALGEGARLLLVLLLATAATALLSGVRARAATAADRPRGR